ncbi:MAG: hypothetical protein IJS28_06910 [Synergistaceae bacterium]|nr:hypothetical protein [Synergistaceae bacterium]
MKTRNSHVQLNLKGKKLLRSISDFARNCLSVSDMKTLYDFTADFCELIEDIEAQHEELRGSVLGG